MLEAIHALERDAFMYASKGQPASGERHHATMSHGKAKPRDDAAQCVLAPTAAA